MSYKTPLRAAVDVQRATLETGRHALDLVADGQSAAATAAAATVTAQERAGRTALALSQVATTGPLDALSATNPWLAPSATVAGSMLDAQFDTVRDAQVRNAAAVRDDLHAARDAETARDRLDALVTEVEAVGRMQDATEDRLSTTLDRLLELVNTRFDTVERTLDERIAESQRAVGSDLENAVADLDERIGKSQQAVGSDLEDAVADLDERIGEGERAVGSDLEDAVAELDEKIGEGESNLDERIGESETHLDARLGEAEGEFESRLRESQEQLELKLETVQDDLDARVAEVSNELVSQLAALEQRVGQLRQQVQDIDETIEAAAAESGAE